MSSSWQVEMLWKCTACSNRNLGRFTTCQRCGKPKTGAEEYEMPDDTSRAAAVVDPRLLALAEGGANWRCGFCGSDQRRQDGTCGHCGADQGKGGDLGKQKVPAASVPRPRKTSRAPIVALLTLASLLLLSLLGAFGLCVVKTRSRLVSTKAEPSRAGTLPQSLRVGTVERLEWLHELRVDRYKLCPREGFAETRPPEAVEVRSAGKRVHHTDRVQDGFETQTYSETVSGGYSTESYTEREACGQDCKPKSPTCRRQCTSNKNGFANCRDVCTGGGQDCTTKYCNRTKTRQVPKTKTVSKTRQVPRFKDVPRYQDWFTWKVWDWTHHRTLKENGDGAEPTWPAPEVVKLGQGLNPNEREREVKTGIYTVHLRCDDGATFRYSPPDLVAFRRFSAQMPITFRVSTDNNVRCLGLDFDDR